MEAEEIISAELSRAVFEKATDGIICYKPFRDESGKVIDFIFVYLNDAALVTLEGSREHFVNNRFLPLFPGSIDSGLYGAFLRVFETGVSEEIEFHYSDEKYIGWYKDIIIKNEDGLIVFFRNITEKKELEIKLAERTAQLEQSNKEKEILLKEIHHRVKNNLQIISSMLNLQSHSIKDPYDLNLFRESQNRIRAMALIHQKLYEGRAFSTVNFSGYIKELISSLMTAYTLNESKINLTQNIEDIEIPLDFSVNIGIILNELITNAIKYAFPGNRKGNIFISIKSLGGITEIIVSDDGIGIPAGVDIFNTDSLGLFLVTSLTEQMNGLITVNNTSGTKFTITYGQNSMA